MIGVEGVLRVDDDVVVALAQNLEHLEDVLRLDVVGRVGLARRGEQGEVGGVRREVALEQRVVNARAVLDQIGDGEFRLDAEEEAEVARLQVQINEHGRRAERGGEVGGDEGRAAAALAGKDGDRRGRASSALPAGRRRTRPCARAPF